MDDEELAPAAEKSKVSSASATQDMSIDVDELANLDDGAKRIIRAQADVPQAHKVGFLELFQFATRFEMFLNGLGLICAAAAGAAQPLMTLVFGNLTTSFTNFATLRNAGENTSAAASTLFSTVQKDALYLVGIGAGMTLFTWVYSAIWTITGERITRRIRQNYLRAVLRQNIAYFDQLGSGEVATRIESDAHLIQEGISEKVAIVVQFASTFCTGYSAYIFLGTLSAVGLMADAVIAYIKSWRLALVLSSMLPALILVGGVFNKFIAKGKQEQLRLAAQGGTLVEEVLSTIRTTYSYGLQERLAKVYDEKANILIEKVGIKMGRMQGASFAAFFFIIYSGYALAFYWGTTLLLDGDIVPGDVITAFFAILFGAFSLVQIAPMLQAVGFAKGAGGKLFDTINRVPPIDCASEEGLKPSSLNAEIVLRNLNFVYPSRPSVQVLSGFTAIFKQGQTTALVGGSGSGKSTIVSLLERFYDPIGGTVELDGHDVRTLNLRWLRSKIGFVSQEPVLFAATVAENVAMGLLNTEYEKLPWKEKLEMVQSACKKANADDFIRVMPQGYDTNIGERGMLLSGGQKQRVSIARAIVADPPILLLDEATSALDTNSERVVQAALDVAAKGRTTIAIAHRLSTIRDAEQIIVMHNGTILEVGNYEELVKRQDGPFARLVTAQRFREAVEAENDDELETETNPVAEDAEKLAEKAEVGLLAKRPSEAVASIKRHVSSASSAQLADKRYHDFDAAAEESTLGIFRLFWRLLKLNNDHLLLYVFGLAAACTTGMIYPVFGIVFGSAIATFSETGQTLRDGGDRNALYFFILALVATLSIGTQNWSWFFSGETLARKLRLRVYRDVMRQDVAFFDREENSSGSLTSNVSDYAQKITGLFGVTGGTIVQSCVTLIGGIIVGLCYAPKVAGVGIAVVPFTFTAGFVRLRVVILKDKRSKASHARSAQMACEAAAAIKTVASLTRENDVLRIYEDMLEEPYRIAFTTAIWSNLIYGFSQSAAFFGLSLLFWYGAHQLVNDGLSTGHFYTALMAVLFGSVQAGNMFAFVPDFSQAVGAARAVVTLMDSAPEIVPGEGQKTHSVAGQIRFNNVHFRYPSRPNVPVLRGLSLNIKPGTFVALVGPSGCGKSTIIQLIERFYDPLKGQVQLDGRDISALDVQDFRKHYALVAQEPTLYDGTLRENVLWGSSEPDTVTEEQLERVCRDANILDFIKSLPEQFETSVGSKGAQLSGGQKQRLALARALIRNPKVLLLDEATSALDSTSEQVVQKALDQASKGRTTVAVAHRLTTIQSADLIVVLLNGKIHEYGKHAELMRKQGMYFERVAFPLPCSIDTYRSGRLVAQQTLDRS